MLRIPDINQSIKDLIQDIFDTKSKITELENRYPETTISEMLKSTEALLKKMEENNPDDFYISFLDLVGNPYDGMEMNCDTLKKTSISKLTVTNFIILLDNKRYDNLVKQLKDSEDYLKELCPIISKLNRIELEYPRDFIKYIGELTNWAIY